MLHLKSTPMASRNLVRIASVSSLREVPDNTGAGPAASYVGSAGVGLLVAGHRVRRFGKLLFAQSEPGTAPAIAVRPNPFQPQIFADFIQHGNGRNLLLHRKCGDQEVIANRID